MSSHFRRQTKLLRLTQVLSPGSVASNQQQPKAQGHSGFSQVVESDSGGKVILVAMITSSCSFVIHQGFV